MFTLIPDLALAETLQGGSSDGSVLVLIAYAFLWILVAVYVGMIGSRQNRLDSEIHLLRRKIDAELGLFDEDP